MSYETEQARLLRLMQEIESDDENYGNDDDDEEGEVDHIDGRSESSGSEQEFEDDTHNAAPIAPSREPCFIGKDQLTKWNKHCPPKNVRTRSVNIMLQLPGVKNYAKSKKSPQEIWQCLFDEEMLNIIVDCTNIKIESIAPNFNRERDAKPTNIGEIKALIGILYLAGVRKGNHMNLADFWRTDGSGIEAFRLVMNRIRFQFLMRCIRFDDIRTRKDRIQLDKLAPLRTLFDRFNSNQKNVTRILSM